jgi:hypothetical protein
LAEFLYYEISDDQQLGNTADLRLTKNGSKVRATMKSKLIGEEDQLMRTK